MRWVYFFGGLALVLLGGSIAGASSGHGGEPFAGLGLTIAGGLCFVASALVHCFERIRQE